MDKVAHKTRTRALEPTAKSVVVTDRDGVIEHVNAAFEAMTRSNRKQFFQNLWSTLRSGRTFRTINTNRTKDGRLVNEELAVTPLQNGPGAVTHFVVIGRAVPRRRRGDVARRHHHLEREAIRFRSLLHNEVGQYLAMAHLTLAGVARVLPAAQADRLGEVRQYLDRVEERLREVSRGTPPPIVADLGLAGAIRLLADGCERRIGIPITVESSLNIRCPASIESLLYGFVCDALANIGKHAHATRGAIVLGLEVGSRPPAGRQVYCSISDDGGGFDVDTALGAGEGSLRRLRERLAAVGGNLSVTSALGKGTTLQVTLPVES